MKLKQFSIEDFDEYTCMYNSYLVLTGRASYTEILEKDEGAAFIFNPTKHYVPLQDDAYDILTEYFEEIEQYEICEELRKAKSLAAVLYVI
jgi:hypothetical protein|tara:strand:- start:2587 stop:2859 length:273 start_codon:yes stop_codon:yes gene_type:complete